MTEDTQPSDERTDSETKTITVHGWATLDPTSTIVESREKPIEDIKHDKQIEALRKTVREHGYNPEQFHIEVDYIEEKHTPQTTLTDTIQYNVFGWCEYAPSAKIEISNDESLTSVSDSKLYDALKTDLNENGINPEHFTIEIDEVLIE